MTRRETVIRALRHEPTEHIPYHAEFTEQEYRKLMDYVKKTDPKAFITVYSVSEISYQPKK